ncbi:efflux RND transporter periplasmic adaptor subunit [Chelatococcus reniformis]|uniref:efflux RND transporter periplasmic adaptor subunit n=1 Tax=Chelatococcus reniformis TaxID=1494448 RepID=UPI001FCF1AAE|nr:efflux RND transporter periplasmic adaptor subunit [Chelatococcus reniformis]
MNWRVFFTRTGVQFARKRSQPSTCCVAALGFLASIAGAAAQSTAPPPPVVSVAKPVVKQIVERDDFIGRFEAVDTVDLRARVSGYLDKVHFQDGALVKAGDLLFSIDPRPYQTALRSAQAAAASATARVQFAKTDLERAANLRQSGNITEQLADQRRQALLTAQGDLDSANAAIDRAKLDLDYAQIRAPFSGRISRRFVSAGNLINANETLLSTMISLDPIQFYFDVDERSYLAYLQDFASEPGRPAPRDATVTVSLTGEDNGTRKGRIDFVDIRLDQQSGTVRGRAVFDNKDLALTPGLFGRVRVPGSRPYKAVLIPDEALGSDQSRRIVYTIGAENKIVTKPVRTGPRIDGYRVIRDGLGPDDVIVVNGLARARPGTQVSPKMTELPASREPSN